jgi:hypothetical protein
MLTAAGCIAHDSPHAISQSRSPRLYRLQANLSKCAYFVPAWATISVNVRRFLPAAGSAIIHSYALR